MTSGSTWCILCMMLLREAVGPSLMAEGLASDPVSRLITGCFLRPDLPPGSLVAANVPKTGHVSGRKPPPAVSRWLQPYDVPLRWHDVESVWRPASNVAPSVLWRADPAFSPLNFTSNDWSYPSNPFAPQPVELVLGVSARGALGRSVESVVVSGFTKLDVRPVMRLSDSYPAWRASPVEV